jgi:hypothetical protein
MTLNNAHSKALEPGCLVRFCTPLSHRDTVSQGGEGEGGGMGLFRTLPMIVGT